MDTDNCSDNCPGTGADLRSPGGRFRYQNFDQVPQVPASKTGYYGGSVILADYCPYIQEFTWKSNNVIVRGSHCAFPENNPG